MESKCTIDSYGNREWRNSRGMFHREDGPAIEWSSGNKAWYLYNECHREDGPAIEYYNGRKYWYLNNVQYNTPEEMPLSLFLAYCKYEYNKKCV